MKHITIITTKNNLKPEEIPTYIPKIYCIIPAAGLGSRFQSSIPKQYTPILDMSVLEYTLSKFCNFKLIKKIIVPISKNDSFFNHLSIKNHSRIYPITGGNTRFQSVFLGLQSLSTIHENDWILIHDAVRPCILISDIKKLLKNIKNNEVGGLLGTFCNDTLKKISSKHYVLKTISREQYIQAQTPQIFRKKILMQAYEHVLKFHSKHLEKFTDESSLIETLGLHPLVIVGSPQNIKLTYPEDVILIRQILTQQKQDEICE